MPHRRPAGNAKLPRAAALLFLTVFAGSFAARADPRTLTFAGREWTVRSGEGGPGPNNWSDSPESVWVDGEGLHLKVRKSDGVWHCAEVATVLPTRHGMHRFHLTGRTDLLDRNVVASPFLYRDDEREVDIEFSRWGRERGPNTQYVVQPFQKKGNIHRFAAAPAGEATTHCMDWHSGHIHFLSFPGHADAPGAARGGVREWTYKGPDNPREEDGLRVHINLWLVRGMPPSDGKEAEFVVKNAALPPVESPQNKSGRTPPKGDAGRAEKPSAKD